MLSVLVVDDLQVDRLIIKIQLSYDYRITTLSSAVEARAFATTHTFDVALLNVMLRHDLDCIDLLRDLENIAGRQFLAIATTCYIDSAREKKIMAAGFASIMKKPFDKNEFNNLVLKNIEIEAQETAYILRK